MQNESVKKLFKEQVKQYSRKSQYQGSPLIPLILKRLKNKNKKIEICEFGGGAGQLFGEIQKTYPNCNYTDVEIINDYRPFLISKKITFVLGSILDSHFPDKSFDVIIIRDVIHHLVGNSYKETFNNQKHALRELKRLLAPGGVIFIEELTNDSSIASKIIYYLTQINSKIGINVPSLGISSNAFVSFLSSSRITNMCLEIFGKKNIVELEMIPQQLNWQSRVAHLGGAVKKAIIVIRKI